MAICMLSRSALKALHRVLTNEDCDLVLFP